jgi:hypothetical protein
MTYVLRVPGAPGRSSVRSRPGQPKLPKNLVNGRGSSPPWSDHLSIYNREAVRAASSLKPSLSADQSEWPEVLATVTECKYEVGAGRALAFGIPTRKHFLIRYNYFADGEFHGGEFRSAKPIPQGHLFPIRYDPDEPHDHKHARLTTSSNRNPTFVIGIFGSFILMCLWLVLLRGCH